MQIRQTTRNIEQRQWISEALRQAVRTSGIPQYLLARRVERDSGSPMDRSVLSAWLCGITPVRAGDPRVAALGRLVGVAPDQCFSARAPRPAPRRRTLFPSGEELDPHLGHGSHTARRHQS